MIRYIKYRLKAKGRHGTHSPFVYAFVEDVLHDKRNFYASGFIAEESKAQQLDKALSIFLFKTIHFLQAESVVLPGNAEKYAGIVKAADARVKIGRELRSVPTGLKEIIIIDMCDVTDDLLQLPEGKDTFSVIILRPHLHEGLWQKAIADKKVLMSLDCWEAGLLLRDNSFKVKQHFYLK